MSWISSSETVTQAGATVVFCDLDPETFLLDPASVEAKITDRTVGIIPVHLYGQPADMDAIMAIADRRKLWVIEDCAQSHLATYKGRQVGTFGVASTFSFYPGKNLGAMGDAGAVVTNDKMLADRMAMFARHGGLVKGDHVIEGVNSRLDGLQAAILLAKLPHLPTWTRRRREVAARYTELLADVPGLTLTAVGHGRDPVWHLFVVHSDWRDELAAFLKARGIQTVINYPRALPFLPCYSRFGHEPGDFPVASALQGRGLSLPIFAEMSDAQIEVTAGAVREFCINRSAE
jgi:dTDP-4-amino-4,6-dideoxygalactose transaminase